MGCTNSKLDDLPAVALCRERCGFLHEAIQQRFALAEAHIFYLHSLKRIGASLHSFIEQDSGGAPLSPKLNLPPHRKGDPVALRDDGSSSPPHKVHIPYGHAHARRHSHSNSGSHLRFHSEDSSDDDEDDSISHLHHSDHSSPLHHYSGSLGGGAPGHIEFMDSDYTNPVQDSFPGGGFLHMNYMKNKAAPSSAVFEQRPVSHETVHFGESSSSSYYSNNDPSNPYPMNYYSAPPYLGYPNYGGGVGGGGGGGGWPMPGYYGSLPPYGSSAPPPQGMASSSKAPPPPPPSPPRASAWDFLNPFESYDKYYPAYTPSRDSKELREEEGIPDLEDEDYQHEVVKEVDGTNNYAKSVMTDDVGDGKPSGGSGGAVDAAEAALYQARPSVSLENDGMEYEVHVVEKKVVDSERSEERGKGPSGGPLDASQVAFEIKIQFERASDCGNEIAKMLEVGKLHYQRKHVSKMLRGITPVSSQPSTSKSAEAQSSVDKAGSAYLDIDEDLLIRSKDLSSIMQKLYLWEKKLYNEVKAEEKMRVVHERKCRKLKHLDERGAEAHKVDATRTIIRSLSTKIRIAIQIVDKLSVAINKIRDEELWPQLNELIRGLTRMWKSMLECHHNQCQAIREARNLGHIGSGKKLSDDHLQATLQLEHEILDWTSSFARWIDAQKGYVRALNNWLVKCLLYEPEVTADGIVPFSPGRIGAPPVFVICNQWAQALDRISEREVIDAMRIFALGVFHLWEQDRQEMRERLTTNKDLERKAIQKKIQALEKKNVLVAGDGTSLSLTGNVVYQSDTSNNSLKGSLQRIFEAMERFVGDSVKVYEELMQRSEEERLAREH